MFHINSIGMNSGSYEKCRVYNSTQNSKNQPKCIDSKKQFLPYSRWWWGALGGGNNT